MKRILAAKLILAVSAIAVFAQGIRVSPSSVNVYSQGSTLCTAYQGCDQGVQVEFCAVTGMPHCWPDNCYLDPNNTMFQAFKASPPMWQFFSQYSLP